MEEQITIWTAEDNRRDEVRQEYTRQIKSLRKKKGDKCIYCGSSGRIEFHHIIPIACGGDNRESNLVPLCEACHYMAHHKKYRPGKRKGRKPMEKPEGFNSVADAYIKGEHTLLEAMALLNLKRQTFYKMLDAYREEFGDDRRKKRKNSGNPKLKKGVRDEQLI